MSDRAFEIVMAVVGIALVVAAAIWLFATRPGYVEAPDTTLPPLCRVNCYDD